jgi:hypothetical protein
MPNCVVRFVLVIAILGGGLPAVCSGSHPIECDNNCVTALKKATLSYKPFAGSTSEQWQGAFETAMDELAGDDWSQRLSDIQQEFCKTTRDYSKIDTLETALFNKLTFEWQRKIGAFPYDPSNDRAMKFYRAEGMKDAFLKVKIRQISVDCLAPPPPAGASKK